MSVSINHDFRLLELEAKRFAYDFAIHLSCAFGFRPLLFIYLCLAHTHIFTAALLIILAGQTLIFFGPMSTCVYVFINYILIQERRRPTLTS